MSVYDLDVTNALLSTTRSVRKRLDLERPVPRDIVMECIQLSTQAPTGANEQSWRWVVVTAPQTRAVLADLYRKGAGSYLAESNRATVTSGDPQTGRVFDSARHLLNTLHRVPVHVIPCIRVRGVPADASRTTWTSVMGSIFPAVWSFQLALRARGLGSVLTTLHLDYEQEAADLLGIPADVVQVALLPVAYTIGTDFRPAKRRPAEKVTHWEHW